MDRKKKSLMDLTPQLFNNSVERFLRGFDFQEARTSIERLNVTSNCNQLYKAQSFKTRR